MSDLPDHFSDEDVLKGIYEASAPHKRYNTSLGLLLKVRTGMNRLIKRQKWKPWNNDHIMDLMKYFSCSESTLLSWTPDLLVRAGDELAFKCLSLSPKLMKALDEHPLYPPSLSATVIVFDEEFLDQVKAYHASVERPDGTFSRTQSTPTEILEALSQLDREVCPSCNGRRQVYCGPCGGKRLTSAVPYLPDRVSLPFDILLLIHWLEITFICIYLHFDLFRFRIQARFTYQMHRDTRCCPSR